MPPAVGEPILYSVFKMSNVSPLDGEARFLKALTHPARLAIVDVLRRDEACVCHLEAVLGQRQAFISQHLMILRDAGIVQDRRVASNVFYRIADRRAVKVLDAVAPERRSTLTGAHASCPCPKCTAAHSDSQPAIQRSGSAVRR
jgi:ArsR family transcriptional regulator